VGVEKLDIAENQDKSVDRKCPDDPGKSFIGHLDAMQFLRIYDNLVFQQPRLFSSLDFFKSPGFQLPSKGGGTGA
jgi:hypothetical protein